MEAIFINAHASEIRYVVSAIIGVKFMRENLNLLAGNTLEDRHIFLSQFKKIRLKSSVAELEFEVLDNDGIKQYQFIINELESVVNANELNIVNRVHPANIEFIDNFGWSDRELIFAFNTIQTQDKEPELNAYIHEFDNTITSFKVIGSKPQCGLLENGGTVYRDIVEFGDGLKHYISIICAMHACKDGYLFIDEIDNGIYYEHLDRLWELIFDLSKTCNCQVFATTHSKEMLEAYARVAQKLQDQEVSLTTLVKNRQNEIKALTLDYSGLINSVFEQGHEVR
ncbi:AAA family ATPase [Methylomonas paludis]|nr:AAA family ATPase [Methylomonas paludis]